ncbi:phytoene synthase [Rhizobium sp. RU20A]|uniref:phytoene/squalene synthase family protein n=1 Tax=Rhizobium sp. RU20A TaxID=1907412 RepID=UPI0009566A73|nr:phytoene/squalene synthase family protein [Rhizobium sp. RU20A]SIR42676.1 phytoene synthase [Rhizobium sp. RU20A]
MSEIVTTTPLHRGSAIYRPAALNYGFSGAGTDLDRCTASIRRGSKSFHIASLLLPRATRQAAHALYAFCRHSDDAVDARGRRPDVLERLRERLDRLYAGTPSDHACDRAFAQLVETHGIPKAVPVALLDGFEMDMTDRQYRTIGEVKDYAAGVASSVGIMMALVMGTSEPWALARAADLGLAMQLTNIARDVGEDLAHGRLYLPSDWLAEAGVDAEALRAAPRFTPAIGAVVARLLAEADQHYALAHAGIVALPADCRHAIRTAALTYRDIGRQIAGAGHDSLSRRARTSLPRKLAILLAARRPVALTEGFMAAARRAPADPSVASLVAAATGRAVAAPPREGEGGIDRFAALLLDLQHRARTERRPPARAAGEGAPHRV